MISCQDECPVYVCVSVCVGVVAVRRPIYSRPVTVARWLLVLQLIQLDDRTLEDN